MTLINGIPAFFNRYPESGMGWDGTGRDGTGRDGMGWDGIQLIVITFSYIQKSKNT